MPWIERAYSKKLLNCILKLLKEHVTFSRVSYYKCGVWNKQLWYTCASNTMTMNFKECFCSVVILVIPGEKWKKISEFQNSITLGECLIKSILRKAESCLWLNHIHRKTIEDNSTVRQQQTWHLKQRDDKSWSHMASSKQRATVAWRAESLTGTCWMLGAAFAADVDAAYANEV